MDVSFTYLLDNFETKALSLTEYNYHVLYSFSNDDGKRPSLVTYLFSNFATKNVSDLMDGSEPQEETIDGKASWISSGATSWKYKHQDKEELRRIVNTWIEEKTKGLIRGAVESKDIVPDALDSIFVGTVAFQGEWSVPFIDAGLQDFTPLCGDKIQMPFMTSTEEEHYVKKFKDFTLLSIPYKQFSESVFEMLVFLPDQVYGSMILREFIGYCETVIDDVIPTKQKVSQLLIPKFTLNTLMFAKNTGPPGKIRSTLTIDETGTRAASVTAYFRDTVQPPHNLMYTKDSTPVDGIQFLANRPFVFVIRENKSGTKIKLFSGALVFPYCNDGF